MNTSNPNKDYSKLAQFISDISNAPFIALLVFSMINFYSLSSENFITVNSICILFSCILPIAVVLLFQKKNNIHRDLLKKEHRKIPLLGAIISYLIGTIVLYIISAPLLSTALMFCYFSNTLIVYFITIYWKISIHSMGMAGPTVALLIAFGASGIILGLFVPFVMWARLYLKRHTISQVIAGFVLGFMITGVQMYLILGLHL